ncbi:fructosamine kinase family protein [Sagittula sp. NFXS13]|uniref:fructosamine kinase family protein n=1 Tax=Sagittula sp. NFXS13 TaxID=2819095 RepID=UPI0032DE63E8
MKTRIASALGAEVTDLRPLHGGDLSEVVQATLSDGRHLVAKLGAHVAVEARMLRAIARTGANTPKVLHHTDDLLLLEHLLEARPSPAGWQALGTTLRQLHSAPAQTPGWTEDYAFGALTIDNQPRRDWPTFWDQARLRPFLPSLPKHTANRLSALLPTLPNRLNNAPLALLHGDLWTGNALFTADSAYLIDPAIYHGDPEVDLAMLHVFGTPPDAFWQGYGTPREGWHARRSIYQLYPALVHHRLFGAGYLGLVDQLLDEAFA